MHIPASHRLLSVDLNLVRECSLPGYRTQKSYLMGCAAQAPGNSEEPTPSQVGWNMLIAQVPDLLTEGNSGEAEALQHNFLSPSRRVIFNLIWLVFSNWFSSSYYFNWAQENFSGILVIFKSPVKAMQNRRTTGAILCDAPDTKALLQESCTTGAGSGRGGGGCPCKRAGCQQACSHQWAEGKGWRCLNIISLISQTMRAADCVGFTSTQSWGKSDRA